MIKYNIEKLIQENIKILTNDKEFLMKLEEKVEDKLMNNNNNQK